MHLGILLWVIFSTFCQNDIVTVPTHLQLKILSITWVTSLDKQSWKYRWTDSQGAYLMVVETSSLWVKSTKTERLTKTLERGYTSWIQTLVYLYSPPISECTYSHLLYLYLSVHFARFIVSAINTSFENSAAFNKVLYKQKRIRLFW